MSTASYKKKLIEVALPLEAINRESAREKSIRHGHPSTLHLWWARRPLAACRAVLFASLVDDPSSRPEEFPTEEAQDRERQRLFRLIEELVKWENSTNETVLAAARAEILKSTDGNPPPVLDPFCGGGSIPLEAQRLGLEAHASDLNPVPVLITKALIEIPPKFAGRPPVNAEAQRSLGRMGAWKGAAGLAEDVRYYGKWMRDEAEQRIGHLYPKVKLPAAQGGGEAMVVAWLWARTVICPNPACGAHMPLVGSLQLATRKGKEAAVQPVVDRSQHPPTIRFSVHVGPMAQAAKARSELGTALPNSKGKKAKATFVCVACDAGVATGEYIDTEATAGRMGVMPLAVVAESARGRMYVTVPHDQSAAALSEAHSYLQSSGLADEVPSEPGRGTFASNAQGRIYGFRTFGDYFTKRQQVLLTAFCRLVGEARERALADARAAGVPSDERGLLEGGTGAAAYADAVATYLGLATSKLADYNSSLSAWSPTRDQAKTTFARQALPMVWDFTEVNPFAGAAGDFDVTLEGAVRTIRQLVVPRAGVVEQRDAAAARETSTVLVSTDPPYYDNIGYADLSDFFYVWLRRALSGVYPTLFGTLLTPKAEELIASPYRFDGNKSAAQRFFEVGLGRAFERMREMQDMKFPLTVFYAFKQSESAEDDDTDADQRGPTAIASTGWETMLEGLLRSGFLVDGTWPVRTERGARSISIGTNALASSIVLVCRPRPTDAPSTTRRQFLSELQRELPVALRNLQHGNIAPVDLAQAAIGPGMAVFSRYARVLESDGQPMRVRTALALINQVLAETLAEQEGEMDADTRWALTWFDENGFAEGQYGRAEVLATAKNTAMPGLVAAGIVASARGKVRLLRRDELAADWDPVTDARRTVWEATHHLNRILESSGEGAAAALLARLGEDGERARDLAYRLYTTCERRGWAQDAQAYNALVVAWPEIARQAAGTVDVPVVAPGQGEMFA